MDLPSYCHMPPCSTVLEPFLKEKLPVISTPTSPVVDSSCFPRKYGTLPTYHRPCAYSSHNGASHGWRDAEVSCTISHMYGKHR